MKNGRVIFEENGYRIVEYVDEYCDMDNLKGDCYNPKHCPEIDPDELKRQEKEFEDLVNREGVYGYVLEYWNEAIGKGWEHSDSCWGFVGQYSPGEQIFNHYIVEELKGQIPKERIAK